MDSKCPNLPLRSERTGVQSRNHGKGQPVDCCPGYHHTSCSYSETIDTGATTHAYTKESTGIDTGMVCVTLPFDNVAATPNGIRVKHPDGNISQETHNALLKLTFLPVGACRVHLFDTLESGWLISLGKLFDAGCTAYLNAKKVYIFLQGKIVLQGVRSTSTNFLCKLNKYHNQYQ